MVKKLVEPVEKLVDACSQNKLLAAVNYFLIYKLKTQWSSHGRKISGSSQKMSLSMVKTLAEPVEKMVDAWSQNKLLAAVHYFLI